jgi:four helix bundle protein
MKDELDRKLVDLKTRRKAFALRVIRLYTALARTDSAQLMRKQLRRSRTSVGAHYREGTRSRSEAEFITKIEGAIQELEETAYWLELLGESGVTNPERLKDLQYEADELTAILIMCVKNTKERRKA